VLKILKTCLIVLVCLFSLAQCGLEYLPYLTPPVKRTSGSFFLVQKTKANDSEFVLGDWEYQGIELYYKLYVPGTGVPPASDQNYTQLSELQSNGFFRISSYPEEQSGSADKPLIDITGLWPGKVIFRIDPGNLNIVETGTATEVVSEIRRGVRYVIVETGYPSFRPFLWSDSNATNQRGFDASHADVSTDLFNYMNDPINTGSPITMAMYALSYGKTGGILIDLYSDAVYLGAQSVYFDW
jgi:hypothetical protein